MDFFLAAPSDEVQSWLDEPTAKLRWKDGILEQMNWRRGFNSFGQEVRRREDWVPVPVER